MKRLIIITLLITMLGITTAFAAVPKFKLHKLDNLAPGCNYSINTPVIMDYDNDGDQDILLITKEGVIYLLENLYIEEVKK